MSDPSEVSFVPSEDLEHELDDVVIKLKNELKKMNLRIKDLEKTLKAKEEETKIIVIQHEDSANKMLYHMDQRQQDLVKNLKANEEETKTVVIQNEDRIKDLEEEIKIKEEKTKTIVIQNEDRFKALSAEVNRNEELLKGKECDIKTLKENSSRENRYLQTIIEANQEHIKRLEEDIQTMHNDIKELNVEHSKENEKLKFELNENKLQLKKRINAERLLTNEFEYKIENLKRENTELAHLLENTTESLRSENDEKTTESNKLAGGNLTVNNPNIADLSDEKRPTKLAEEYSELYDNEWTDAFEDVQIADEQEKTTFMLTLFKRANEICNELSSEHMRNVKKGLCTLILRVNNPSSRGDKAHASPYDNHEDNTTDSPQIDIDVSQKVYEVVCDFEKLQNDKKKTIMELRKVIEDSMSEQLATVFGGLIADENGIDHGKENAVFVYIKKCVNFCWSICRHDPPVYIRFPDIKDDIRFDTNVYKPYTKTGKYLNFIVWPALYLHEGGPMLSKGVAQGKNK